MGMQTKGPLPAEVEELQKQLQEWRRTRNGPGPIPAPIWDAAVPLAIRFGVCRIGRAVGLDYTWLRKKVARAKEASPGGSTAFQVLHHRWVVERTFAWLGRYRRLARDFEATIASSLAWMEVALIRLLVQRLGDECA